MQVFIYVILSCFFAVLPFLFEYSVFLDAMIEILEAGAVLVRTTIVL